VNVFCSYAPQLEMDRYMHSRIRFLTDNRKEVMHTRIVYFVKKFDMSHSFLIDRAELIILKIGYLMRVVFPQATLNLEW
jgi:hypothetical protein